MMHQPKGIKKRFTFVFRDPDETYHRKGIFYYH